jgi:hypothetical protein
VRHPNVLLAGIDQLVDQGNQSPVDVFKLPHHGSKANVTRDPDHSDPVGHLHILDRRERESFPPR